MAFFLRFRLQLGRTVPNLVPRLEEMAVNAVVEAGGEAFVEGDAIRGDFDENSPGFWLDILFLVERLTRIVDGASGDLHGYSVLLGGELPGRSDRLCRILSGGIHGGGVYLDRKTSEALRPYVTVEERGSWAGSSFFRLKEEKIFVSTARSGFILPEKNIRLFEPGRRPAVFVTGRFFEGRRDNLYRRIGGFSNSSGRTCIPPLFVRFGGGGLNPIADAWPEWLDPAEAEEGGGGRIAGGRDFLFRQRLREEPSPFAVGMARQLFDSLLAAYADRAVREGVQPVVVLENLDRAERAAADLAIAALSRRRDFILAGLCVGDPAGAEFAKWSSLLPRKFAADDRDEGPLEVGELPADLWEMGYLCLLIGRVYPPDLISGVIAEMGKNPGMISRAISMLHALGVIDTTLDPRPWRDDFQARAEAALGGKTDDLRALVRKRILAWVAKRKIGPCVRLLEILGELGGGREIDDDLVLQAVHGELGCTDGTALERFADSGSPDLVGQARLPALRHVAAGLLALHFGDERKIRDTFACPPPECTAFPLLKTQVFLNEAMFHLGWHDGEAAKRAAKTATLLCQKSGNSWLSRCNRLFALASLSERRIGETNDYLGFALENAVKSGNPQETGLACYYTSAAQLLHGNLSKSLTLAKKALRHFLDSGSPEWADRSRFMEGRLAFENGRYEEAREIFADVRERPHGDSFPEKTGLLDAWAYRAGIYSMKGNVRRPKTRVPDTDLFRIEAAYFSGDFRETERLSESLFAEPPGEDFFYGTEQPDWRSGFAQCELLCFPWEYLRDRIAGAYRSLAQSHLSSRDGRDAVQSMQTILQGSRFAEIDPFDTFYHYALFRVLRQTKAGLIDLRTAASMAHKRMQVRSDRIENPEIRRQYLTGPYWNRVLEEAAKEFKLV